MMTTLTAVNPATGQGHDMATPAVQVEFTDYAGNTVREFVSVRLADTMVADLGAVIL